MGHDACGIGFIADTSRRSGRRLVALGLTALRRLAHRGAPASLGAVDGCGVLTAIPWPLLADALGGLPRGRSRALGMLFLPRAGRAPVAALVERELAAAGAVDVRWRVVPVVRGAVLPAQRASTPLVLQVVAGFRRPAGHVEPALYRARRRIEREAERQGLGLTIVSLSARTVVHKALVTPEALDRFYPDLADERFASPFVVFHQRFSTNTSADWALAQPFRTLAHNGEINTIAGNRLWMRARGADASAGIGDEAPVSSEGSDSRSLDDALELLRHRGYSLAHALSRLVPPAWERDRDLPRDVRAFYEFQSLVAEPWDGPSALVFSDGRSVGAALDRNGFRPARVVRTADGLVGLASEVGILSADEHEIVGRGRLGPGEMMLVDLARGHVAGTQEIRRQLAAHRPYARLMSGVRPPSDPSEIARHGVRVGSCCTPQVADLANAQDGSVIADASSTVGCAQATGSDPHLTPALPALFGCSREEVELLLRPMIEDAREAIGSMGDDTPPAVLSLRARQFADFFRQRFAQVTNPPVDPYREASVMSLTTALGAQGDYIDESAPRPPRLILRSPILTDAQAMALRGAADLSPTVIQTLVPVADGGQAFESRLTEVADLACAAVERGSALLILTDRAASATHAPLPAVLATAAVHHALIGRGLRMRASIAVEAGDARDPHQTALVCAYGASAVCPWLGYEIARRMSTPAPGAGDMACARYLRALEHGLLTVMSKMGVCTFSSYCGSQLFEILGLDRGFVDRFFPGTPSPVGGLTLADVASAAVDRHRRAVAAAEPGADYPGLHGYRRDGEYHATNPLVVRALHRARAGTTVADIAPGERHDHDAYRVFLSHVYDRPPAALRDLLTFARREPIAIEDVEPVEAITRRFFASAMSVGALSPEAHRTVAVAMNRLGARSNSGEGGEEPDRFVRPASGDWAGNRTKQVASARFGVTPAYLRSADELQIKIAQGSKPGEGGQLPAIKVVAHIARLRHAQPGTPLISPPVHHDIYSIEDLAELMYDLRAFHPGARMNVKLVASSGVGIIAAGVAKAGADAIQISGHDGGTGASPRASIKHVGLPWEIGLADAHRTLARAGLRHRVVLQTDGGIKAGRDVAIAAALGADEYGFGTAALVALGCVMARQCHANTCPVGIATQRDDLRAAFAGTPEMLIAYLRLVAGEVREILAALGLRRLEDLIGRSELLAARGDMTSSVDVSSLITQHRGRTGHTGHRESPAGGSEEPADAYPTTLIGRIRNTDRAFGAAIAGSIAARHGDAGLPDGSVRLSMTGSAGQSFGAFAVPGMKLTLVGDANDGLGKGMHGGEIIVAPAPRERGRRRQVIVGNAALYGATGGRVFVGGEAGERFAVRNSGATAVVEGVGDHACEYMTGGTVVILGAVGRNFAAGMTGGVVYVRDPKRTLAARLDGASLAVSDIGPSDYHALRALLEAHERATGSRLARMALRSDPRLSTFCRVEPAAAARRQARELRAG